MLPYDENRYGVYEGKGIDDFLGRVSYVSTYISGVALNREYFLQVENRLKFSDTNLNQVYNQLEMLRKNPDNSVLYCEFFGKITVLPYFEEIKNIINKFEDKQKNMIGSITDKK